MSNAFRVAHVFSPGDDVPEWAARLIVNEKAWDSLPEVDAPAKPFSQLNKTELEQVASDEGVSLDGLTTNDEFRAAIKAAREQK